MARHRPHLLLRIPDGDGAIGLDDHTRHHLNRVLRYPPGSPVSYTDGSGMLGAGVYEGDVVVRGEEQRVARSAQLTVAVAPPASKDRSRFLVEKLAELGVARLVWLTTRYGEGRPPKPDKIMAWSRAALEQSRGLWLLEAGGPTSIADAARFGQLVFADHDGDRIDGLPHLIEPVLCVGPEGGFADDEIPDGAIRLSLGDTILRVETAAIVGATLLANRF